MKQLKNKVVNSLLTVALFLLIGVIAFKHLEGWNTIEAFYFSVATLTTVGFGDYVPTTDMSRLFTSFYMLAGAAIVLSSLGMVGSEYHRYRQRKR